MRDDWTKGKKIKIPKIGIPMLAVNDFGSYQNLRCDAEGRIIVKLCSCVKCRDYVKFNEFLMLVKERGLKIVIE